MVVVGFGCDLFDVDGEVVVGNGVWVGVPVTGDGVLCRGEVAEGPKADHVLVIDIAASGVELHEEDGRRRWDEHVKAWVFEEKFAVLFVESSRQERGGVVVEPVGDVAALSCYTGHCVAKVVGQAGDCVDVSCCVAQVVEGHERTADDYSVHDSLPVSASSTATAARADSIVALSNSASSTIAPEIAFAEPDVASFELLGC